MAKVYNEGMKVYFSTRRTNTKGYFVDFRVVKQGEYFISQFLPRDDKRWARLASHISLESAIKRINR